MNIKLFNHVVTAVSLLDYKVSHGSGPRNRDDNVLRTSAGEDLDIEMGCSVGVSKLWCWLFSSDVELSMADWSASGVSHSFGIAFSMNGMHELTYASRFIQLGSSLPHRICNRNTTHSLDTVSSANLNMSRYICCGHLFSSVCENQWTWRLNRTCLPEDASILATCVMTEINGIRWEETPMEDLVALRSQEYGKFWPVLGGS